MTSSFSPEARQQAGAPTFNSDPNTLYKGGTPDVPTDFAPIAFAVQKGYIDAVDVLSITNAGAALTDGEPVNLTTATTGAGSGLMVDLVIDGFKAIQVKVVKGGTGYAIGDVVTVNGYPGIELVVDKILVETTGIGEPGPAGPPGPQGEPGADGASAYEVAVANGFTGTEAEWLATIEGEPGPQGVPGEIGPAGPAGLDGASAYEVAVAGGFVGTEEEWLATLQGEQGIQGEPGVQGEQGIQGIQGPAGLGITFKGNVPTEADLPTGAAQGDLWVVATPEPAHGFVWDETAASWADAGPVQGPQGVEGPQGVQGEIGPAGPTAVSADAGNASRLGTDGFVFTPLVSTAGFLPLAGGTMTGFIALHLDPISDFQAATKKYVDTKTGAYLPLAGGTMTGAITLPTSIQSLAWGTTGYNVLAGTGGVAVRLNTTNLVTYTGTGATFGQKITTTGSGAAVEFGSGGGYLAKVGTVGIGAYCGGALRFTIDSTAHTSTVPVVLPADPTTALQAATKQYVDAAGAPVNVVTGSQNGTPTALTLWSGTQAQYDAIATKDSKTVYVVTA